MSRPFAAPDLSLEDKYSGPLAKAFALAVLRKLERAVELEEDLRGLVTSTLSAARETVEESSRWWNPEIGTTLRHLSEGNPLGASLQALMALHAEGLASEWHVNVPTEERLSFCGYCFTVTGQVHVGGSERNLAIETDCGRLVFERTAQGWRTVRLDGEPAALNFAAPAFLSVASHADRYVQAWREPIDDERVDFIVDWPPPVYPDRSFAAKAADQVTEALDLLAHLGPGYCSWVHALFRGVVATPEKRPGLNQSASYTWHAGVFSSGFPRQLEELGEVIVHEMSHQHFLLLDAAFPLVDKQDNRLYFSALKRDFRPLKRMLLAFHATINMLMYWSDLLETLGSTDIRQRQFELLRSYSRTMRDELEGVKALSDTGRELIAAQLQKASERSIRLSAN